MSTDIPIAFVLRQDREDIDVNEVCRIIGELGIRVTASGRATVSARIAPSDFQALFGFVPRPILADSPDGRSMGHHGGFECEQELPVPVVLQSVVASISVEPPALRMV